MGLDRSGSCPAEEGNQNSPSNSFCSGFINKLDKMKEIKLNNGFVTQVDDEDFEWLNKFKWYASKLSNKYYARKGRYETYELMHRLIMKASDKQTIDHIDNDSLNNQKHNLRFCTNQENCFNQGKKEYCSSQYKGVCFYRRTGQWMAYIRIDGILKHLGYYNSEITAALKYDVAAEKYFGKFANFNFK